MCPAIRQLAYWVWGLYLFIFVEVEHFRLNIIYAGVRYLRHRRYVFTFAGLFVFMDLHPGSSFTRFQHCMIVRFSH